MDQYYTSSQASTYDYQSSNYGHHSYKRSNQSQHQKKNHNDRTNKSSYVKTYQLSVKDQPKVFASPEKSRDAMTLLEHKRQAEIKIEEHIRNKSDWQAPIPKGNSAYSKAKRAEYVERNLDKAIKFYKLSIQNNERTESAIKDLATVLHQQGKTEEACNFLQEIRSSYQGDLTKFDNLLNNLKKQITPSGNCQNRTLVIPNVDLEATEVYITGLFENATRIVDISFCKKWTEDEIRGLPLLKENAKICLVSFPSYSAARKTIQTLKDIESHEFYWMNVQGEIVSKVESEIIKKATPTTPTDQESTPTKASESNTSREETACMSSLSSSQRNFELEVSKSSNLNPYSSDSHPNSEFFNGLEDWRNIPMKVQYKSQSCATEADISVAMAARRKRKSVDFTSDSSKLQISKTWNWAVFVNLEGNNDSSSDSEPEETREKAHKEVPTKSVQELVYENFGKSRLPNGMDREVNSSRRMKYDVLSEIQKKEELFQRERHNNGIFVRDLFLRWDSASSQVGSQDPQNFFNWGATSQQRRIL